MTLDRIATIRMSRRWPSDLFVTLWLDCGYASRDDKPEVSLDEGVSVGRIDLRALVGLPVAIHAESYTERLSTLFNRVKEQASFVLVAVSGFGDDVGFAWDKLHGDREL